MQWQYVVLRLAGSVVQEKCVTPLGTEHGPCFRKTGLLLDLQRYGVGSVQDCPLYWGLPRHTKARVHTGGSCSVRSNAVPYWLLRLRLRAGGA